MQDQNHSSNEEKNSFSESVSSPRPALVELDADETMLLLITKNWAHKNVESDYRVGTTSYIQDCCDYRCFGPNHVGRHADMFTIYISLCEKLLSPYAFANILSELNKNTFYESIGLDGRTLIEAMIAELSCRQVTDLLLDESLVSVDVPEREAEA